MGVLGPALWPLPRVIPRLSVFYSSVAAYSHFSGIEALEHPLNLSVSHMPGEFDFYCYVQVLCRFSSMARVVAACDKILCDENSLRVAKSLPSAEAFKNEGNADYAKKRLRAALGRYTEALCLCPSEETAALAVCHGNRSAVLFELSEYEVSCIFQFSF